MEEKNNKERFVLAAIWLVVICAILIGILSIYSLSEKNKVLIRQVEKASHCSKPKAMAHSKPIDEITIDTKHSKIKLQSISVKESQVPFLMLYDCFTKKGKGLELIFSDGAWWTRNFQCISIYNTDIYSVTLSTNL